MAHSFVVGANNQICKVRESANTREHVHFAYTSCTIVTFYNRQSIQLQCLKFLLNFMLYRVKVRKKSTLFLCSTVLVHVHCTTVYNVARNFRVHVVKFLCFSQIVVDPRKSYPKKFSAVISCTVSRANPQKFYPQ